MAISPTPIIFKITDAGKNAILDAENAGLSLSLTHVAIGTAQYAPTGNEKSLKAEINRQVIVSGDVEKQSHTLRFSAMLNRDSITEVYEIGLITSKNILFAVASTTQSKPLLTIHPDITYVGSFGLSLSDINDTNINVVTDPNGSLSLVIMENHLAAPDPHPQYLNAQRFQMLMRGLIPIGYPYYTHDTANPKPLFDELLGLETYWRRITGKIMLATDPNDPFINDVGIVLGQQGMTELANNQRPHVYPLQTTNLFERYDPSKVIETVWNVKSDKNSVKEGDALVFTITANNLPDGQILPWVVKEGALNSSSNDITSPDKTESGTVILKNGQAIINFATTADDNLEEPQKHVRLTVGAPANLSINVPINDTGHHETVIHISKSTYDGIVLDEYYKTQAGRYPKANELVRFIVDEGVDIVAPNTGTGAIVDGSHWPTTAQIIIENRGRILGRGGDGGRSAYIVGLYRDGESDIGASDIRPAKKGGDGGVAIKSTTKTIAIENYSFIAGGGGGGGGMGAWFIESNYVATGGGGGTGGGAPFGKKSYNEGTWQAYQNDPTAITPRFNLPNDTRLYNSVRLGQRDSTIQGQSIVNENYSYTVPLEQTRSIFIPMDTARTKNYLADFDGPYVVAYDSSVSKPSQTLLMSSNATIDQAGHGGYGGGEGQFINFMEYDGTIDLSVNHGGDGGGLGEDGQAGVISKFYASKDGVEVTQDGLKQFSPSATGGKAGYVYQGNVNINNFSGGQTKGRTP
ncbi:MAG: hypothetical protein Q4P13_11265 [Psychrobacter sp.]|nr:hypothetical protein [Psychrobacter sp.]